MGDGSTLVSVTSSGITLPFADWITPTMSHVLKTESLHGLILLRPGGRSSPIDCRSQIPLLHPLLCGLL
jgi:hypothetical protein